MQENIINLIDENGVESQFEIILTLEAEGKEYAILMPVNEEESDEALVFRIDQDEEGEMLVPLEDDKEYEIVVLINGGSASASEILTAAIVDNNEGIAIGTTTFGKGLVQSVRELKDGTGYKLNYKAKL